MEPALEFLKRTIIGLLIMAAFAALVGMFGESLRGQAIFALGITMIAYVLGTLVLDAAKGN